MRKREIMIYAYTAHNLGDDLFIHNLCRRYPQVNFLLYAPKRYRTTFQQQGNLQIIPSDTRIHKIIQKLRPLPKDAIYIGGSLFIEQTGWIKDWRRLKRARKRHRNFFILGANFGPYKTKQFYNKYEAFFKNCTDICFRDHRSYDLFRHIPQVRYANDIVFTQQFNKGIRPPSRKTSNNLAITHPIVPGENNTKLTHRSPLDENMIIFTRPTGCGKTTVPQIVISIIYPAIRQDLQDANEAYFQGLANFAMHAINQGYEIVWMAFCKQEQDNLAITCIYEKITTTYHKSMSHFHYETNIQAALDIIASAHAVVATRFHAMILGLLYQKPIFAILYSDKMRTVIEDNELNIAHCDIKEISHITADSIFQACQQAPIVVTEQIKQAEQQFTKLDHDVKED